MSSAHPQPPFDAAAYLDWEHHQPGRHEFVAGEVFAMTGATDAHVTITLNLASLLRAQSRRCTRMWRSTAVTTGPVVNTAHALAAVIIERLNDPAQRRELAVQGRRHCRENFDRPWIAGRYAVLLSESAETCSATGR